MNPLADLEAALKALPHGPEFRFIDELRTLDPGKHGTAIYRVRGSEPFLAGHFPGEPLFPGVLLLEAGAQLAGVVAQSDPGLSPLPGLRLTAARAVKMLDSVKPGETIEIQASVTGRLANLVQADVRVMAGGRLLLEAAVALAGRQEP